MNPSTPPQSEPTDDSARDASRSGPAPRSGAVHEGTVIKVPDVSPGLLVVEGAQRSFQLEGVWLSAVAPAVNQRVEVRLTDDGAVAAIEVVKPPPAAGFDHPELQARLADGKQLALGVVQRMGRVELGAALALWVSFFVLTFARFHMLVVTKTLTFWDILGFDSGNPLQGTDSHGLWAWLGVLAIAAPFAAPYVRHRGARLLNAAPLGFLLLTAVLAAWAVIDVASSRRAAEAGDLEAMGKMMQGAALRAALDQMKLGLAAFTLPISALVLAWRGAFASRPDASAAAVGAARGALASVAGRRVLAGLAVVATLGYAGSALLGGPSERTFAAALNARFADEPLHCWSLQDMDVTFPVHLRDNPQRLRIDPILSGLLDAGLITVSPSRAGYRVYSAVDLTDAGRAAGAWDPQQGFCVGRRQVEQVSEWTEPVERGGALTSTVSYTWTLGERGDWVDDAHFAHIPGIGEPVSARAQLRETDDGWEVVGRL